MFVEFDLETICSFIDEDVETERSRKERQERINYEFTLFKHFCSLFGLKKYEYESLVLFNNYCLENGIELIK